MNKLQVKVAANNLMKNQLYFNTSVRAFASSPQKNPFDKTRKSIGSSQYFSLPTLKDARYSKYKRLKCSNRIV